MRKKLFFCLISMLFASLPIFASDPKFPFPQDQTYANGIKPAGANHSDVQAAYDIFLRGYYEENGDQARIKWDTPAQTVSEGIGYGMLIFVFMDNATNKTQTKFDKLWKYYQSHLDGQGLMNWKINGFAGTAASNGATDGDIDAAFALCLAYYQWGDAKYKTDATSMTSKIFSTEVGGSVLEPGDDPNFTSPKNPSYFITAGLNFFDKNSSDFGSHGWSSVISGCYSLLSKCANGTTGLVPDWCNDGGGADARGPDYLFDAARTPWRMAWAYCWYGDAGAKSVANKMVSWFKQKTNTDPSQIGSGYKLDGTAVKPDNIPTYLGPLSCAGMVDAGNQAWLDAGYARLASFIDDDNYYNQTIKVLNLLLMTGNCLNFATAEPKTSFTITANCVPAAGGKVTFSKAGPYSRGDQVTVTVTPNDKYTFTSWSGDFSGTSTTQTVTISQDVSATAYFNAGNRDLIDNCDDGDNLTNIMTRWFDYNDSTSKGQSTVTPSASGSFFMTDGGANGSDKAAKISYTMKKGQASNPFAGMGFGLVASKSDSFLDISKATSLTFYFKGDTADVRIETSDITDAGYYFKRIPKSADWKLISVQWKDMAQPSWTKTKKAFNAAKATKIAWQTPNTVKDGSTGEIWVDEIHLPGYEVPVGIKSTPFVRLADRFSVSGCGTNFVNVRYRPASPADASLTMFDMTGRMVFEQRLSGFGQEEVCRRVSLPLALGTGAYLVRLKTDGFSLSDKILLAK
jgi:endo-1,4-beta-D-glucanase Y